MRVYVPGTFDLLHVGHVRLLRRAAELGEVWVGVNTDEFAARYKRPPVVPMEERIEMLNSLRVVAGTVINHHGENSRPAILRVNPRFIVHGDDWTGAAYMDQLGVTEGWLDQHGIEIRYLPYTEGVSTTDLIRRADKIEHDLHNFRWSP